MSPPLPERPACERNTRSATPDPGLYGGTRGRETGAPEGARRQCMTPVAMNRYASPRYVLRTCSFTKSSLPGPSSAIVPVSRT